MVGKRCNPFIEAPLSVQKVLLMALATIVFLSQVLYGTIKGFLWFDIGKKTKERFLRYHKTIQYLLRLDMRLHPWFSCKIHNPYGETFERPSIAICNHQSMLDTLCLLILSPNLLMVTNKRVKRNPIVRMVLKYAEFAMVSENVEDLITFCRRQTQRGYTIIIFPEGERSADCNIKRFHNGAFYIAKELKLDILPLYLHGSGHVLPLHKAFQNKGSFYVEIGKRIPYIETYELDLRKQASLMRHHYATHYEEICKDVEDTHYFSDLVGNLFTRIHLGRYARNLLQAYKDFSEWIDVPLNDEYPIVIDDKTHGVFSLLFALVHPFVLLYVLNANELQRLYYKCNHLPANINFIDEASVLMADGFQDWYSIDNMIYVRKSIEFIQNKEHGL